MGKRASQSRRQRRLAHKRTRPHAAFTSVVLREEPSAHRLPLALRELVRLTADDLVGVDIARMNLLCAEGLPGSERLHVHRTLAEIDRWAKYVHDQTQRFFHQFERDAHDYEHSEPYFRMLMLVTVLQLDLGVRYNLIRMREIDFTNSRDLFIHGMINDDNGGTCASMPVLYVAVGRRLGYPLRLVTTREHVFCRWDGLDHPNPAWRERRNIEGTSEGMHSFDDDHYRHWPAEVTQKEIDACEYLKALTPSQELAMFLCTRGHCAEDNGMLRDAFESYKHAHLRNPENVQYLNFYHKARNKLAIHNGLPTIPHPLELVPPGFVGEIQMPAPYREHPAKAYLAEEAGVSDVILDINRRAAERARRGGQVIADPRMMLPAQSRM